MAKSITIRLVPTKQDKIYKPTPGYADLYALMNKLHLNSVNEAVEEETQEKVSELELEKHKVQERINQFHKEESTLNVLENCLETIDKMGKKQQFSSQTLEPDRKNITDFNKIIEESELNIKKDIEILDPDIFYSNPEKFMDNIETNLKLIHKRKAKILRDSDDMADYIAKLDTLKENINSSQADIDSLEVAWKNLKITKLNQ
jgi:hypothetical protein